MNYFILLAAVTCSISAQRDGTIRLVKNNEYSNTFTSGIVEVYDEGEWAGVCDDEGFSKTEADVICHQLGYTSAQSFSTAGNAEYGSITNATYTNVQCLSEDYQVLFQCTYDRDGCDPDDAVTVNCVNTRIWDNPYSGQVRLQKGMYTSEGVVEIYCNDQWGTVCDGGEFGPTEARTVCRELGYYSGRPGGSYSGNATQPIWLRSVDCSISSYCLSSCQSCPSEEVTGCVHSNDASVECSYDSSIPGSGRTLGACDFSGLAEAIALLIGILIGVSIFCCLICICAVFLPLCICCCLGVGIGAAAAKA